MIKAEKMSRPSYCVTHCLGGTKDDFSSKVDVDDPGQFRCLLGGGSVTADMSTKSPDG